MDQDMKYSRYLTFSQAQGYEELPSFLALEEVSGEARIKLWNLLSVAAWYKYMSTRFMEGDWEPILGDISSDFFRIPIDEFKPNAPTTLELFKRSMLRDLPFNRLFDLLQMIMRHTECPMDFTLAVADIFRQSRLAYIVDVQKPATILPAATEHEGQAIVGAIEEFRAAGLEGTEAHLRNAGQLINQGDWPGSVRESMHAVESVARQLDPEASKTLGPALKSLEKSGQLHPALENAFRKLYGYTSDEEGIRHPLITASESPVGQDEAVFMLGACASFASYLWRRHRDGS